VLITHPDGRSHQNVFRPLLAELHRTGSLPIRYASPIQAEHLDVQLSARRRTGHLITMC